jgi:phage terminase large subunit-like protein
MKNIKNTIAAAVMMSALTFGTSVANAGIIIAKSGEATRCTDSKTVVDTLTGVVLEGIIIAKTGIIIAREGIIIAREDACTDSNTSKTREGIIIA